MHRSNRYLEGAYAAGLAIILAVGVTAQSAKPVCELITDKDVAALIGSVKQTQAILGPDSCVFTAAEFSLTIQRSSGHKPEVAAMMLALPKNRARPGDVVKEEPGIGQGAVSELSKGRLNIIAMSGDTIWTLGVQHVYNQDLTEKLPQLRELARKLAGGSGKSPV